MELEMIKRITAGVLGVDPREITLETTFADDLGADSLDLMQIALGISEAFNIKLPKEELANVVTVNDALTLITKAIDK